MNLLKKSIAVNPGGALETWGHVVLRVSAGLMIFYIHGWHKAEGWFAWVQHGTPWKLAQEVAEMHFPAPIASAMAATAVQFISSLFLAAGLFTRINAAMLAGVLAVAILQNVLAGRDPQLAILYTLVAFTLALLGGGRYSLDAMLFRKAKRNESHPVPPEHLARSKVAL